MISYKNSFFSPFCLPSGKADDTPSPSLPRARSRLLRLHPWTPWISPLRWDLTRGILNFRSIRVSHIYIVDFLSNCAHQFKTYSFGYTSTRLFFDLIKIQHPEINIKSVNISILEWFLRFANTIRELRFFRITGS